MTLHYKTPEERAAHDRERKRANQERHRAAVAAKAEQRETRYQRIENRNESLMAENEQLVQENGWLRQALTDERNKPPKVVFEEKTLIEKVPTLFTPTNIGQFMHTLWNPGDAIWRGNLLREQEGGDAMKGLLRCPKCSNEDGPFVK